MNTPDRFSGDPRLIITPQGADLDYEGGQPVMDAGVENQAVISLFTKPGWCGNLYLSDAEKIGSDFEDTCAGALTLKAVTADIPDAAQRALKADVFPQLAVAVANPQSWDIELTASLGPGTAIRASRNSMLWSAESANPATARISTRKGVGL